MTALTCPFVTVIRARSVKLQKQNRWNSKL
jgi:hypothetical protein